MTHNNTHLTEFTFLTHHVLVCVCACVCEVAAGRTPRVTLPRYFRWLSHRCVCVCVRVRLSDAVVRVSAPSASVFPFALIASRARLHIGALVRLSAPPPQTSLPPLHPPPARLLRRLFSPCVSGFFLQRRDKRASRQPEAICHPGPSRSAPVRCLLPVCPSLVCPTGARTHIKAIQTPPQSDGPLR